MAKKYTLHYLNDKEFDNLPYAKAKTALGCADEKTGNAYVRRTGIRPIDEFVTEHEIAELIAKVSPHEEDGIRYKEGAGNLGQQLINAITGKPQYEGEGSSTPSVTSSGQGYTAPGGPSAGFGAPTNQSTSTAYQDINRGTATGSLGAGTPTTNTSTINQPSTSGLTNTFENYQSNQLGFANAPVSLGGNTTSIGTTGQNLSTINAPTTSQTSWSNPNTISNMFSSSQANNSNLGTPVKLGSQNYNVTGGVNGLTGTPTNNTATNLGFESPTTSVPTPAAKTANVPLQSINRAPATPAIQTGGEVSSTQSNQGQAATKTPILESLFGKDWKQTLLGQGIKTLAGAGISALGQATAKETQVAAPTDSALYNQVVERVKSGAQIELSPAQRDAITFNYDQQLENARKNITQRFKALRPGSDIANDSQLQQALVELENDFAEQKAAAITAAQLGLTQQQTVQLSQLASADINYLSQVAGVSNQEAADFKAMMASLGAMVATGGQQKIYS